MTSNCPLSAALCEPTAPNCEWLHISSTPKARDATELSIFQTGFLVVPAMSNLSQERSFYPATCFWVSKNSAESQA